MGMTKARLHESWSYPSWANPHLRQEIIDRERARIPENVFKQEFGGEFIGPGIPLCKTCGYPCREGYGGIRIYGHGEPPTCQDCGNVVDWEGRTLASTWPGGIIHEGRVRHLLKVPRNVPPPGSKKR